MDAAFFHRLEGLRLVAKRLAGQAPAGTNPSHALGDGLEFADHRAYAPGDDVRFIDWPCFARMEKLFVRLFHRHSESDVALLLDTSASMSAGAEGKFDHARNIAAALAYIVVGEGRRVLLQPFAESLAPPVHSPRNRANLLPLFDAIGRLRPRGTTALRTCARDFAQRAKNVEAVLLLSDLLDADDELGEALTHLARSRREVIVLHTYAPDDASAALTGPLQLRHAETGETFPVEATPAVREAYASAWTNFRTNVERTCRAHQALYVPMPSDIPIETLLLRTLRRTGVLRT